MDKRPKRRRSKDNPYHLESSKDLDLYMISFIDNKGIVQKVKVTLSLFNIFNEFELEDISQMNKYDRYIEHLDLEEEQLYMRAKNKSTAIEDEVIKKLNLREIKEEIKKLPDIQRSRFIKYYFNDMSYEEIANEENCSRVAVKYSVDIALEKISKKFKI